MKHFVAAGKQLRLKGIYTIRGHIQYTKYIFSDDFLDKLRKSAWLGMVDNVLRAASMTAQALLQAPVVIHGGEGRDMTLVVASMTQIILLPEGKITLS